MNGYDIEKKELHKFSHKIHEIFLNDDGSFKLHGEEAMEKMEALAEEYPEFINIAIVDDDHHSSSFLAFVHSYCEDGVFGTHVWYFPQCAGNPTMFFMYPQHMISVMKGVTASIEKVVRYGELNPGD